MHITCTGTRRDGQPCHGRALAGGLCKIHGGQLPPVVAKYGTALLAKAYLGDRAGVPVTDILGELLSLAGELKAAKEAAAEMVANLEGEIRYEHKTAGEQLRSEVEVWLRLAEKEGRLLSDIAKLNLEERLVRIEEAKATRIIEAMRATLVVAGLTPEQRDAAILDLAARLRGDKAALIDAGRSR